jgi:hypothetical protein
MSVIDADPLQDARKEKATENGAQAVRDAGDRMTEISTQAIRDARNERMSEIGPFDRSYSTDPRPELTSF